MSAKWDAQPGAARRARSKQRWLTVASLQAGLRETAMLKRDGGIHSATLEYDEVRVHTPFVVKREVIDLDGIPGNLLEQHRWWFASLDDAREHWKTQAYQIRG